MAEMIPVQLFFTMSSAHPLCLTVKRVEPERIAVLTCSSCRMVHRVTTGAITRQASAVDSSSPNRGVPSRTGSWRHTLVRVPHAPALSVREMDVFQDACGSAVRNVGRHHDLTVSHFETHQKQPTPFAPVTVQPIDDHAITVYSRKSGLYG